MSQFEGKFWTDGYMDTPYFIAIAIRSSYQ